MIWDTPVFHRVMVTILVSPTAFPNINVEGAGASRHTCCCQRRRPPSPRSASRDWTGRPGGRQDATIIQRSFSAWPATTPTSSCALEQLSQTMTVRGQSWRLLVLTSLTMAAFAANPILCRLALKETGIGPASFTPLQAGGFLLALGGLVAMLLPGVTAPPLIGAILMLGSGIAWGVYTLQGRTSTRPVETTAGNFLGALAFALLLSAAALPMFSSGPAPRRPPPFSSACPSSQRLLAYCCSMST